MLKSILYFLLSLIGITIFLYYFTGLFPIEDDEFARRKDPSLVDPSTILLDEDDEDLHNFLSYVAYLNQKNDVNYIDMTKEEIMLDITSYITPYTKYGENELVSYKRANLAVATYEMFHQDLKTSTVSAYGLKYYRDTDSFRAEAGGDGYCGTYLVKIENQTKLNNLYTFTIIYAYPDESAFTDGTLDDYDCFKTDIVLKVNEKYEYSKYQLLNYEELESTKVGKIKDYK